jgi:hypothetical protein
LKSQKAEETPDVTTSSSSSSSSSAASSSSFEQVSSSVLPTSDGQQKQKDELDIDMSIDEPGHYSEAINIAAYQLQHPGPPNQDDPLFIAQNLLDGITQTMVQPPDTLVSSRIQKLEARRKTLTDETQSAIDRVRLLS